MVAASAGNHAQGVALAAKMLGIHATVFMPEGAPIPKEKATRGYGADVRFHGHTVDEALVEAKKFADETGAVLIHPFDHPDIVTGQGTCGLEILEQCPEVDTVMVATGGGGFIAGIATAIKSLAARRTHRRGAGRGRGGLRRRRWPPGHPVRARDDVDDGRRHRGRLPRRRAVPGDPAVRRRDRHRQRGVAVAGAADAARARQAGRRARRARPPSRRSSTSRRATRRRPSRCSPAATSTRC